MPVDLNKPVRTITGYPARILCSNLRATESIVYAVTLPYGEEVLTVSTGSLDKHLENVPLGFCRELWINIFPDHAVAHSTRSRADAMAQQDRIACVKVLLEGSVGDGLEHLGEQ